MTITRLDAERMDFSDVADGPIGPVTPGDVLFHDFLEPLGMSCRALARDLGVPANRVTGIVNGTRAVTPGTVVLLARRFGTTPEFWARLQTAHDLERARERVR